MELGERDMIKVSGYEVKEKVYEGKINVLYRGIKLEDQTSVLFKFIASNYPDLSDISILHHEYEVNQMINSTNIVKIYSIEEYDKTPILILEDFFGESLASRLNSVKKIQLLEFLSTGIKLSQAINDIHSANIIHKDINPKNIIVNMEKGIVKITDFGISTLLSKELKNIGKVEYMEGTINYISPEQTGRMNRPLDYRTDFYSLGITFYEMLTGFLPFQAVDELGLIHCHLAMTPMSPHEVDQKIPKVVSDIVMKLIEKMAENRYQSMLVLKSDLKKCIELIQKNGSIEYFNIGENDISDRFQIPEKLYGRETEIQVLLSSFERISNGAKETLMVTGYSGVGKSVLVNEINKPSIKKLGHFIFGKFDQYQRNLPYSALIQSLNGLVQQLLAESEDQLKEWKDKLLNVLKMNGQVIIEIIPEVEKIIGKQPAVIELPSVENKNRFNMVIQNFVAAFCTKEHPLVVFLDDLQWADLATLRLLEVLMKDEQITFLNVTKFRK